MITRVLNSNPVHCTPTLPQDTPASSPMQDDGQVVTTRLGERLSASLGFLEGGLGEGEGTDEREREGVAEVEREGERVAEGDVEHKAEALADWQSPVQRR